MKQRFLLQNEVVKFVKELSVNNQFERKSNYVQRDQTGVHPCVFGHAGFLLRFFNLPARVFRKIKVHSLRD
jgi:hypothetical protein